MLCFLKGRLTVGVTKMFNVGVKSIFYPCGQHNVVVAKCSPSLPTSFFLVTSLYLIFVIRKVGTNDDKQVLLSTPTVYIPA